jgi:hypothetical protein
MARKTMIQLCDDLDGSAHESVQTVDFSLDGVHYEIDLKPDNANSLRARLTEYINSARPTADRRVSRSVHDREQSQRIRQWAMANDWEIAHRGRIPVDVIAAYERSLAFGGKRGKRRNS